MHTVTDRKQRLFAHIFIGRTLGRCRTEQHSSLSSIIDAVSRIESKRLTACAVHITFEELPTREMTLFLADKPGAVFFSDSMIAALPRAVILRFGSPHLVYGISFRRAPEGCAETMQRMLRGDVLVNSPDACVQDAQPIQNMAQQLAGPHPRVDPQPARTQEAPAEPLNWFEDLALVNEPLCTAARTAGILDETTYLEFEEHLAPQFRLELGLARMEALAARPLHEQWLLDDLWAAPPWLLKSPIVSMPLTTRLFNVFRASGSNLIGDLVRLKYRGLLMLPNMGLGSVDTLTDLIMAELVEGRPLRGASVALIESGLSTLSPADGFGRPDTFLEDVDAALCSLLEMHKRVWTLRMGYRCEMNTLSVIAEKTGVTRERVRQIEVKAYRSISGLRVWTTLRAKLREIMGKCTGPVPVSTLPQLDPWFAGCADAGVFLGQVLERMMSKPFSVLNIDGVLVVSELSRDQWVDARWKAAKTLRTMQMSGTVFEDEIAKVCSDLLSPIGSELTSQLIHDTTADVIWSDEPRRRVLEIGSGASRIARAVLAASETPLHYKEIIDRARRDYGSDHTDRSLMQAIHLIAFNFDSGVFGLDRHFTLSADELDEVRLKLEAMANAHDKQRQWHAQELFSFMVLAGLTYGERLTKYVIRHALRNSAVFVDLGRMVWGIRGASGGGPNGTAERLDLNASIVALLESAGTPMGYEDIRAALKKQRGVNGRLQVFPLGRLIRVSKERFGLLGRDVPEEDFIASEMEAANDGSPRDQTSVA